MTSAPRRADLDPTRPEPWRAVRPWLLTAAALVGLGVVGVLVTVLGWNDPGREGRNGLVFGPLFILSGAVTAAGVANVARKGGLPPRFANPVSGWRGLGLEFLGSVGLLSIGATPLARLAVLGHTLSVFQWVWVGLFALVAATGAYRVYRFVRLCLRPPSVRPGPDGLVVDRTGLTVPWSRVVAVGVDSVHLWQLRSQQELVVDLATDDAEALAAALTGDAPAGPVRVDPGPAPELTRVSIADLKAAGLCLDRAAGLGPRWRGEGQVDWSQRAPARGTRRRA